MPLYLTDKELVDELNKRKFDQFVEDKVNNANIQELITFLENHGQYFKSELVTHLYVLALRHLHK